MGGNIADETKQPQDDPEPEAPSQDTAESVLAPSQLKKQKKKGNVADEAEQPPDDLAAPSQDAAESVPAETTKSQTKKKKKGNIADETKQPQDDPAAPSQDTAESSAMEKTQSQRKQKKKKDDATALAEQDNPVVIEHTQSEKIKGNKKKHTAEEPQEASTKSKVSIGFRRALFKSAARAAQAKRSLIARTTLSSLQILRRASAKLMS